MITPITATFPALNFPKEVDYPTQEDWDAFSAAAELNYGILSGEWSNKSEEFKAQVNNLAQEIQDIGENAINAITFDNIAQLKLNSNMGRVDVLGYYANGDGGGGTFYWDATSTEADNSGTIIQATGIPTGRWKRVFSGAVNVKWFGASTSRTDNEIPINMALATRGDSVGWSFYLPFGEYKCSDSIVMHENISLIGDDIRTYNLYIGDGTPKMSMLKFTNDTDGIVFESQFFKNQIKNIAIWSGITGGTSTKVGLRLSRDDADLLGSTWDGISNLYENILVFGFLIGIKITGEYSWHQKFKDLQVYNCKTAVDIECQSANNIEFQNYYINANPSGSYGILTTYGFVLRSGGGIFLGNGLIEVVAEPIVIMSPIYSNLTGSVRLYIDGLYTEGFTRSVVRLLTSAEIYMDNIQVPYPLGSSTSLIGLFYASAPSKITKIRGKGISINSGALVDGRTLTTLIATNSIAQPSHYNIELDDVSIKENDFTTLWETGRPPNRLRITDRDNGGNMVEFRQSADNTRAYALISNDDGKVTAGSLIWTTTNGHDINVNTLYGLLTTVDPIRVEAKPNRKSVYFGDISSVNGTTKAFNTYSGVRYVNYGAASSCAITVDTTHMNYGDEFLVTDTIAGGGATCTITIGTETITNSIGQFVMIRKTRQSGASVSDRYIVVARGIATA